MAKGKGVCSAKDRDGNPCTKEVYSRGLCSNHYQQARRNNELPTPASTKSPTAGPRPKCKAVGPGGEECPRDVVAKDYCWAHYQRSRRHAGEAEKIETPIGAIREPQHLLPSTSVPQEVGLTLKAMAEIQGLSQYEFLRRLVIRWYNETVPGANVKSRGNPGTFKHPAAEP